VQYGQTLFDMQSSVERSRNPGGGPGIDPTLVITFLNQRMRMVLNMRPYWSGLIGRGILNIPQSQSFANCTMTQGSNLVTSTGNSWPINDVVNTTLASTVSNPGYQSVMPASMTGITTDTLLYVDASGPNPEVVPVLEITPTNFKANFQYVHAAGATLTCSSFSYQQWVVGYMYPIYTVTAVTGANSLLIDQPWAGTTFANTTVTLRKQYYTFSTDLKDFISVVDPQQGISLTLHYPREQIDFDDPQRSAVDWPVKVVDYSPNLNFNMSYELWPNPTQQRQLYFTYVREWNQMVSRTDRPPSFLDPSILVYGALADAWKVKLPGENVNGNLAISQQWEGMFKAAVYAAADADNGKRMAAYSWPLGGGGLPGGNNFWQAHDPDIWTGNY
jgi:hypothetical protein